VGRAIQLHVIVGDGLPIRRHPRTAGDEVALQPQIADLRRILVTDAMGEKRIVRDQENEVMDFAADQYHTEIIGSDRFTR
jgi:hypothetical protein